MKNSAYKKYIKQLFPKTEELPAYIANRTPKSVQTPTKDEWLNHYTTNPHKLKDS